MTTTESGHLAAVLATLAAADAEPYTIQHAKRVSVLPPNYNEVTVERRFGGVFRLTATTNERGYRIAVRALGRTYEGAVAMRELASATLEGARVTVAGKESTPIQFETASAISDDEDPGWYSGLSLWTYVV